MDWAAIGLQDQIFSWLEKVTELKYARDTRLDSFSTSMRDFDDVTPDLESVRAGNPPNVSDVAQRLTDLKSAGLLSSDKSTLSDLGNATLDAWLRYGVASDAKGDELARILLLVLEGRRLGNPEISKFIEYWTDLRSHFSPLDLINNWDSLFAINYLDFSIDGFAPGAVYRDEKIPANEIEFDVVDYAKAKGNPNVIKGAELVDNAIANKIPRGRHRATFCMALEMLVSDGASARSILDQFGFPKRPRIWTEFNDDQKKKIREILIDYGVASKAPAQPTKAPAISVIQGLSTTKGAAPKKEPLSLPSGIDFSKVLVDAPAPPPPSSSMKVVTKGSPPKKVDYQQQAEANTEVGDLAEQFAMAYEGWRLKDHPELLKKLRRVSKEDDSLGYDIESYELDGTPRFIEVKGTLGPLETRFFLSANELECAKKHGSNYLILRVGKLKEGPVCCEVRHPFNELQFSPSVFQAIFQSASHLKNEKK